MTPSPADLRACLPTLMLGDQRRLGRGLERAEALRGQAERRRALAALAAQVADAQRRVEERRLAAPTVAYPPELPVSRRKDEIAAVIRDHQVVVVAGETGSGKTTQLPKICLELGRGVVGQIGHTQPRRIAARSVAERIAEELGTAVGAAVGHKIRFDDTSSGQTLVTVMTDGILLAEMRRDRDLLRYDTVIVDEAHERSLNIDFILGYLKRLLPRRPDLKVVITSATIDPERFSRHFAGPRGTPAPVIEVSGRTYPVEVRHRPLAAGDGEEPRDQVQGICDAVAELRAAGPGDILVFLSGEREIRDAADALAGDAALDVLPLYARLSAAEQRRVFQPHPGRRVVLATNVAETSLTVPGIRYVVDPGTARISRYSQRTKVQRLPIEPISQASADQRMGRCGRTSDGICVRLYSEEDFAGRPRFTDPEILRTSLASVILRMAALGLGDVAEFPFVDPPDARSVADGVRLLEELGALEAGQGGLRLTGTGKRLAEIPADPRLGRMILEAGRNGCVDEVLVIASALSIQDVRERPAESREAADALHARFAEPGSDFLTLVNLWDYLREAQRELSSSGFRRLCAREHLHYLRVREWQDVYGQLRQAAREVGVETARDSGGRRPAAAAAPAPRADPDAGARFGPELADRVHTSVLAGLLSQIGMKESRPQRGARRPMTEFAGARGARFAIFPGSGLARKPPAWVMAAELVETSRLWARTLARIEPEWAEPLAAHLVKRNYSEPRWDARRGAAVATEKVLLHGLPIVAARTVGYARIDPAAAREMFISHALVEGEWQTRHRFFHANQRVREQAAELERKSRRRGADGGGGAALFAFYDKRVPAEVVSVRHFDAWWKRARALDPDLLALSLADLAGSEAAQIDPDDYPGSWGGFGVSYEFAPGEPEDGVSVDIPLARLNQVEEQEFGWQVPGLRHELVAELIRSLPKPLRRLLPPAPDAARDALARLGEPHGDLLAALAAELGRRAGTAIDPGAFDVGKLPGHLRVTFRVTGDGGVLAEGKDLAALRAGLRPRLRAAIEEAAAGLMRTGLRDWDVGSLPRVFAHGQVRAYPALADAGGAADIALFDTEAEAEASMRAGIRRLLLLAVPSGVNSIAGRLPVEAKLAMSRHPYPKLGALLDDCAAAAADQVVAEAGGPVWDAEGYARIRALARERLAVLTSQVVGAAADALGAAHEAQAKLEAVRAGSLRPGREALAPALADMDGQVGALIYPGFVSGAGAVRLKDAARYLRAVSCRLDKLGASPGRDAERMEVVRRVAGAYEEAVGRLPAAARAGEDARAARWLIEELRVSLFAQSLGTAVPVSEKRVMAALDRLARA